MHTPRDFSWAWASAVRGRGPFSFWPQFISYFDLIPEQEAKIRQICSSETLKSSSLGLSFGGSDSPASKVESVLKWGCGESVRSSLINELESFTSHTDDIASSLFHSLSSFLSEQQLVTLVRFFVDKEQYAGVGDGWRGDAQVDLDSVPSLLLGINASDKSSCWRLRGESSRRD